MTGEQRREEFATHTIHVIGTASSDVLQGIEEWKDLSAWRQYFDVDRYLHMHGKS